MRLTLHTDYAFRVLLFLKAAERRVTAEEIAQGFGISRNHLQKVIQRLNKAGYVESVRGRGGGLQLARSQSEIVLGDVVRATEPDLFLVECLDPPTNTCVIAGACTLEKVLGEAAKQFLEFLDQYTLEDLGKAPKKLRQRLGIEV